MIPLEVTLANFLGYDDNEGQRYHFDFRDHRLWSISGDNGAGKSAIFDAITYALFGRHRGGAQRDEELLHKGATDLFCRYAFRYRGIEYRITRTLKKKTKRSGALAYDAERQIDYYDTKTDAWREVPGADSVKGLEEHVKALLGFDYDTFISSVLLLQGESDKLIRSLPSQRFAYLSGILDLTRYRRLEEGASQRARAAREQRDVLVQTMRDQGVPSEDELKEAEARAAEAQRALNDANAGVNQAKAHLARVKAYWALISRRTELEGLIAEMEDAQQHADSTRNDVRVKKELDDVLPRLRDALASASEAERVTGEAVAARQTADAIDIDGFATAVTVAEAAHADAKSACDAHAAQLKRRREEHRELQPEEKLAERLSRADAVVQAGRECIASLEERLAGLPEVERRKARLDALAAGQHLMKTYSDTRLRLAELTGVDREASMGPAITALRTRYDDANLTLGRLRTTVSSGQTAVGALRGEVKAAERTLEERQQAGAEGTCSRCGQPVDADHIAREVAECEALVARLQQELTRAEEQLAQDREDLEKAEETLPGLRDSAQEAKQLQAQLALLKAGEGMAELPADCRTALQGPAAKVAAAVLGFHREALERKTFTEQHEKLVSARGELDGQRRLLAGNERDQSEVLALITRERAAAVATRVAELDVELPDAEEQEATLVLSRDDAATNLQTAQAELDDAATKKAEFVNNANLLEATAEGHRSTAEKLVARIAPEYLPATQENIGGLGERFASLADADERLAFLETAERQLVSVRGQKLETEASLSVVPEQDREPAEMLAAMLERLEEVVEDAAISRNASQELASTLAAKRDERLEMQKRAEKSDSEHQVWNRLTKLLGRGGIQLALMKRDLAGIEKLANPLLSQISGGNLRVRIECAPGRGGAEEITFRCVDGGSADDALDVVFLSGGQKFRVAVALAAAIGQYAGLGGSMPSQIIDEGFGSLDEVGRKEMLETIREMADHFERIILVSHTESFHDPSLFPARYELRKKGRATIVSASV